MAVYDKNGKVIKSAVSYGWEVTSSDVPKALDMWVEHVGEDNALEDISKAMDDDTLIENIEWIAQQWGIGEEVEEERSAWDKYEKAKELLELITDEEFEQIVSDYPEVFANITCILKDEDKVQHIKSIEQAIDIFIECIESRGLSEDEYDAMTADDIIDYLRSIFDKDIINLYPIIQHLESKQ